MISINIGIRLLAALSATPLLVACSLDALFQTDIRSKTRPEAVSATEEEASDSEEATDDAAADDSSVDADAGADGAVDGEETVDENADDDRDGLTNHWEEVLGFNPSNGDSGSSKYGDGLAANGIGDCNEDVDGDGAPNCWEITNGLDPEDASDALADLDEDGYANAEEATDFDPNDADSSPGGDDPLLVYDDSLTLEGRTDSLTVRGTLATCLAGDQVLFTSSAVKPSADDAGFIACTTGDKALSTTLANAVEGAHTVYVWRKNSHGVVASPVSGSVVYDVTGPTGAIAIDSLASLAINLAITLPTADDLASVVLRRFEETDCSSRTAVQGTGVALATTDTTKTDGSLNLATAYCYKAFWYDSLGNEGSDWTDPAYDGTGPTGDIEVASVTSSSITLDHTLPTDPEYASVVLRRHDGSSCASTLVTDGTGVTIAKTTTSVADTGLTAATPYCYKIFWTDTFGNVASAVPSGAPTPSITQGTNTCDRTVGVGHVFYYFASTIELEFTCTAAVSGITTTGKPSYLTASVSGSTVTFSGTAPSATSTTNWSFAVDGVTTDGDATAITTQVISTVSLDSTLAVGGFDTTVAGDNNSEQVLAHSLALAGAWDGDMDDVSLQGTAIVTDMHGGVAYSATCPGTAPYVCNGSGASNTGNTKNGDLRLRWRWSAFDQGAYYLDVNPRATIEGSVNDLALDSLQFTVPIQSAGNVTVATAAAFDGAGLFDDEKYQYDVAVARGSASTATSPAVGLIFLRSDSNDKPSFRRIAVDRQDDPADGASDGVIKTWAELSLSIENSQDYRIESLSNNTWAVVGATENADSNKDLTFQVVSDSGGTTSTSSAVEVLAAHAATSTIVSTGVATTAPFADGASTRIGVAYSRMALSDGDNSLHVVKVNPTASGTVSDDADFAAGGSHFSWNDGAGIEDIDNVRIGHAVEASNGYFYVLFRQDAKLRLVKLRSSGSTYSAQYADVSTTRFVDTDTGSTDQSADLAIGSAAGSTVAGVVLRSDAGACYFVRVNQDRTVQAEVLLSSNTCYNPTIHFNSASGRFVVTYAEYDSANWDIKTTEISLGVAAGAVHTGYPVIVASNVGVGASAYPIKLVTDFHAANGWMAVFYRLKGTGSLKIHGYHVPGR